MSDTSEPTKKPSINIYLGEETKYMEFPPRPGRAKSKFILHPIVMDDIAEIENLTGIAFLDWETNNPFKRLAVLMHALWLSVKKNTDLGMTEQEFKKVFTLFDAEVMFKIIGEILKLSGMEYIVKKSEDAEGKADGAAA